MYQCQLNFAMFRATSALGISQQHLNHPNLLVNNVYRFHLYFHVRIILHHLGISLPNKDGFGMFKNTYIESAYYSIRDVNINQKKQQQQNYDKSIYIFVELSPCFIKAQSQLLHLKCYIHLLKRQSKGYTIIKFCHSNNSNAKNLQTEW